MNKKIELNSETDFKPAQLRDWLNNKYSSKYTGKPFTNADIYQYARRGYLPKEYTGAEIEVIEDKSIGIKLLRLNFSQISKKSRNRNVNSESV